MKSAFKIPMFAALILLLVAGGLVWNGITSSDGGAYAEVTDVRTTSLDKSYRPRFASLGKATVDGGETVEFLPVQPLAIPAGVPVDEAQNEPTSRVIAEDDAILAAGGVIEAKRKLAADEAVSRGARLKSILAKDWDGKGNLLVNELRAGKGFEVGLDQVETFLRGKDLYGWPEGQRNWIGDEMMTMLRQEVPTKAYEIFRDIQADGNAPEAMRDYSIQHISHLIGDGHVGQVGVALIREALESGNSVLASTALISLHRLSEKMPELIKPEDVKQYAETHKTSQDQRLKATASAILLEAK